MNSNQRSRSAHLVCFQEDRFFPGPRVADDDDFHAFLQMEKAKEREEQWRNLP